MNYTEYMRTTIVKTCAKEPLNPIDKSPIFLLGMLWKVMGLAARADQGESR